MSAASKGRKRSPEAAAKTADAKRGVPISEEHRAKLREAAAKQFADPELRARCGAANKGRVRTPEEEAKRKATFAATIATRKAAKAAAESEPTPVAM